MFRKPKKTTVYFEYDHKGSGGSSVSIPLNNEELLDYIYDLTKRHGDLTIPRARKKDHDGELYLTTPETKKMEYIDSKLHGITETVKDYINKNAIASGTEVIAVFAEGELQGLYISETYSRLKATKLKREGYREKDIKIKNIKINAM